MSPLGCILIPGGGKPPYISHIGMCRPKGYGFQAFWSENGYIPCPFCLESGMVFEGTTGALFITSIPLHMNKDKQKYVNWKLFVENDIFDLKQSQDLKNRAAHPYTEKNLVKPRSFNLGLSFIPNVPHKDTAGFNSQPIAINGQQSLPCSVNSHVKQPLNKKSHKPF